MEETQLEKIVVLCFKSINERYAEKLWHNNGKYVTIKNVNHYVFLPWFCGAGSGDDEADSGDDEADDARFKEFLQEPYYFYRCNNNGLKTKYVVKPCFYALIPHNETCKNPAVCKHTFDYMVDFLMLSEDEQLSKIESLVADGFYSDRLQFFWLDQKEDNRHICTIDSSPKIKLNESGYFNIHQVVKYTSKSFEGMDALNRDSAIAFRRLIKLFSGSVERKNFMKQVGNEFGRIFQRILMLEHYKKTNL